MTDLEKASLAVLRVLAENQRLQEENEQLRMLLTVKPPEDQPVTVLEKEKPDGE